MQVNINKIFAFSPVNLPFVNLIHRLPDTERKKVEEKTFPPDKNIAVSLADNPPSSPLHPI